MPRHKWGSSNGEIINVRIGLLHIILNTLPPRYWAWGLEKCKPPRDFDLGPFTLGWNHFHKGLPEGFFGAYAWFGWEWDDPDNKKVRNPKAMAALEKHREDKSMPTPLDKYAIKLSDFDHFQRVVIYKDPDGHVRGVTGPFTNQKLAESYARLAKAGEWTERHTRYRFEVVIMDPPPQPHFD